MQNAYKECIKRHCDAKGIFEALGRYITDSPILKKDVHKAELFHKFFNNVQRTFNADTNKVYAIIKWGLNQEIFTLIDLAKCAQVVIEHFDGVMYTLRENGDIRRYKFITYIDGPFNDVYWVRNSNVHIPNLNEDYMAYMKDDIELIEFLTNYASDFSETAEHSWGLDNRYKEKKAFNNHVAVICNKIVTKNLW